MKRRNLFSLLLVVLGHVSALTPSLRYPVQGQGQIVLHAGKSKMPVFSADDEEALRRMSDQFGGFGDQRKPSKKIASSPEYDSSSTDPNMFQSQAPPIRKPSAPTVQPRSPSAPTAAAQDLSSELLKLAELKNLGVLTDEEFSAAKAKLLGLTQAISPTSTSVSSHADMHEDEYDFGDNIPATRRPNMYDEPKAVVIQEPDGAIQTTKKAISTPNKDWRKKNAAKDKLLQSASSAPDMNSIENIRNSFADQKTPPVVKRTKIEHNYDYDSPWAQAERENPNNEMDFGYDDFELAMSEEMGRGMFSTEDESQRSRGKYVQEKAERPGLKTGDMLPAILWESLVDVNGDATDLSKLEKGRDNELLITYADPRRMTDETKLVISEMKKFPQKELKLSAVVINCDDSNDHRKFLKKNKGITFPLLSDPSKKYMETIKCKSSGNLASALFILDVSDGTILKIWYENEFDAFATNDLVVDEVKNYRKDPDGYRKRQIGLR